jgi:hypothetical protein
MLGSVSQFVGHRPKIAMPERWYPSDRIADAVARTFTLTGHQRNAIAQARADFTGLAMALEQDLVKRLATPGPE